MQNLKNIKKQLLELLNNSHSPYSNFKVASIAIFENGNIYKGVNVESASFGATICAERTSIFNSISQGEEFGKLREIHLITTSKHMNDTHTYPCGICRQIISEASNNKALIFIYSTKSDDVKQHPISYLLPNSFKSQDVI